MYAKSGLASAGDFHLSKPDTTKLVTIRLAITAVIIDWVSLDGA